MFIIDTKVNIPHGNGCRASFKETHVQRRRARNSQFVNPPNDLQQLADAIETKDTSNDSCDFSLVFVENKSDLLLYFLESMECGKYDHLFWLAYPKKSGKIESDLSRDIIWRMIEEYGYRPVSMVSIDDTWNAMRVRPSSEVG
jgi:hypothetical protein